jgi:hypothetical protein
VLTAEQQDYIRTLLKTNAGALQKFISTELNQVADAWSAEDIKDVAREMGIDISDEIAAYILTALENFFDCNYGITWTKVESLILDHTRRTTLC